MTLSCLVFCVCTDLDRRLERQASVYDSMVKVRWVNASSRKTHVISPGTLCTHIRGPARTTPTSSNVWVRVVPSSRFGRCHETASFRVWLGGIFVARHVPSLTLPTHFQSSLHCRFTFFWEVCNKTILTCPFVLVFWVSSFKRLAAGSSNWWLRALLFSSAVLHTALVPSKRLINRQWNTISSDNSLRRLLSY